MTSQLPAYLSAKHGPWADETLPITSAKAEFGSPSGSDVMGTPQFVIEQQDASYLIRPLSQASPIYVNGSELTSARPLVDGDEIAIPPEVIYVFHQSPAPDFSTSVSAQAMVVPHRPGGVTFVAILQFLAALTSIAIGLIAVSQGTDSGLSLLLLIIGVVSLATGVGLWQMREWGRVGTIIVRGVDILFGLASPSFALVFDVLIIIYLLRGTTASHFKQ